VVASVPADDLRHPIVRIGWDAGGRPVAHYELDTATEPELTISCVTAKGTTSRDENEPPPLPTRPEPTEDALAAAREARAAARAPRRISRSRAWR
jgi:hypothetical protein